MSEPVDHAPVEVARRRVVAPVAALVIAALFAGLLFVFARSGADDTVSADTRWMNQPAPVLTGALDGGGTFDLGRRQGSWVILNFFDVTCAPCVQEHPALVSFAGEQSRRTQGAELYSVIWGREPQASRDYLRDNGASWPIVMDDGTIATRLGITKVPETWIIDPNGYVRSRLIGVVTADGLGELLDRLGQADQ